MTTGGQLDVNRAREELLAEIDAALQGTKYWQGGRLDTIKYLLVCTEAVHSRHVALLAARHQLVAAFGIVRSHASDEYVQNYQRALMLCDAALTLGNP